MALLLLYALVPVLLGVAFAFAPGLDRRFLGPLQTGAIAAALTVVLAELLPEATSKLGVAALGAFAAGLAVPAGLEILGRRMVRGGEERRHGLALEAAFLGLLVHQTGDGLQVGAAGVIENGMSVIFAVAAHTTPLIAVTVLAYAHHDGRRVALARAVLLLLATAVGVVFGAAATTAWLLPVEPWLRAIVAGVLLHILGHDLTPHPPPGWTARLTDLAAMLAGVLLPLNWLMRSGHHHFPEDRVTATISISAIILVVLLHGLWLAGLIERWYPFGHRHDHDHDHDHDHEEPRHVHPGE